MRRLLRDFRDFHDPGSITRRAHLRKALDGWGEGRPGAVLDFGCGRGRHSFLVSSRWPEASVVGVDVDEEALLSLVRYAGFIAEEYHLTVGRATAWLTDLDYILARRKLHPLRAFTYLSANLAAFAETKRLPASGRGVMVVARRSEG